VYEYFLQKLRPFYSPKQDLSLNEATTPWRGRLKFRTYSPGKITKIGVLVRKVCETVSGYICKMEIHVAEGQKLEGKKKILQDSVK
jgi:hypothetical protein